MRDDDIDDNEPTAEEVGGVNATPATVRAYLMSPYGGKLTREHADQLITKYAVEVKEGQQYRSFANYVGGKILRAEGLPEHDA